MPKMPAKDGGHSAFTNHKIMRNPDTDVQQAKADTLTAWREPDAYVKDRNLSLALIADGLQNRSSAEAIQGYKILSHTPKDFPNDPVIYSVLGAVLLQAKEPEEALKCFRRVVALKPKYASYHVNLATALIDLKQPAAAVAELEKARALDPLLQGPVQLLHQIYHEMGQEDKSKAVLAEYDKAMGSLHQ
jgi:predicted Zn-dependent protease